jgi:MFS family permease
MTEPSENLPASQFYPCIPKVRLLLCAIVISIMALFIVAIGVAFLWVAFSLHWPVKKVQIAVAFLGVIILCFPAAIPCTFLYRRWKTGHWLLTKEEVLSRRSKWANSSRSGWRSLRWASMLLAIIYGVVASIYWFVLFTHHSGHLHNSLYAVIWTCLTGWFWRDALQRQGRLQQIDRSSIAASNTAQSTTNK